MAVQVSSFHFPESWFDMRSFGAVLDHKGAPAPSVGPSSAPPSRDHQRSILMRRRDEARTLHFPSSHAPQARADDPAALLRLILHRVRQRAFVVLNPYVIPRIDPAVARHCIGKNDKP